MEAEFFSVGFSHISYFFWRCFFTFSPINLDLSWIEISVWSQFSALAVFLWWLFELLLLWPEHTPNKAVIQVECCVFQLCAFLRQRTVLNVVVLEENQGKLMNRIIQQSILYFGTHGFVLHINTSGEQYIFISFYPKRRCLSRFSGWAAMDGAVASQLLAELTRHLQQPDLKVNRQLIHKGRAEKDGKTHGKMGVGKRCGIKIIT